MARILWVSDAGTPTGFGKVTHEIGERLVEMGHDVHVLAIGWNAAVPVDTTLKLYRAEAGPGAQYLGYDRSVEMVGRVDPDITIIVEDPPQMRKRLLNNPWDTEQALLRSGPVIGYTPVDGYNIPPGWKQLTQAIDVVAMTEFGAAMMGTSNWVHHGVDPKVFHPVDEAHPVETRAGMLYSRAACREAFGIAQDAFVIGRVDTNSGRKDWGSTIRAINMAIDIGMDGANTWAAFHTKANAPQSGIDISAVVSRGEGQFLVTNENDWPIGDVVAFVNCFDLTFSTSRGEGWGLGLAESLACGVPVLATDCSAITEVVGPGGVLVAGKAYMTNPYGVDLVIADVPAMAAQLKWLAGNPERRQALAAAGLEHVKQFSWDRTAAWFDTRIETLLEAAKAAPVEDTGG